MDTQANLKTTSTHFFSDNPEYFPTPRRLLQKMWAKLPSDFCRQGGYILDPSAGSFTYKRNVSENSRLFRIRDLVQLEHAGG